MCRGLPEYGAQRRAEHRKGVCHLLAQAGCPPLRCGAHGNKYLKRRSKHHATDTSEVGTQKTQRYKHTLIILLVLNTFSGDEASPAPTHGRQYVWQFPHCVHYGLLFDMQKHRYHDKQLSD